MEEPKRESFFRKIKGSKGYTILSAFIKSAAVGLFFAILCFAYDLYHDKEQDKLLENSLELSNESLNKIQKSVEELNQIKQSLSTRYLGIFPDYITEIGMLYDSLSTEDTIIIFEDVLYYGIKSRPKEFYEINKRLLEHAMNGGSITVAYYDVKNGKPKPFDIFHKVIIESRIDSKYHAHMKEKRQGKRDKEKKSGANTPIDIMEMSRFDSVLCEEYFAKTRIDDKEVFKKDVDAYLSKDLVNGFGPARSKADSVCHQMCFQIDSVKQYYLGRKAIDKICFSDYEKMYREMSEVIKGYYGEFGIEMIPLNEYLTMSCWMVQNSSRKTVRTVLAFPSKYSTDEIGFYSQDEAFSKYIGTMLKGVKQNQQYGNENDSNEAPVE